LTSSFFELAITFSALLVGSETERADLSQTPGALRFAQIDS